MSALRTEHELHARRRSRNLGLLAVLLSFALLIFGLSMVKISNGQVAALEGFDHQVRPGLLPPDPPANGEARP